MPAAAWPHPSGTFASQPRRATDVESSARRRRASRPIAFDLALTIRRAGPADAPALAALAQLDSARPLQGEVLLALLDSRPVAAVELSGPREIADPFRPSDEALTMLRVRARQLRNGVAPAKRHGLRRRAATPRTAIR